MKFLATLFGKQQSIETSSETTPAPLELFFQKAGPSFPLVQHVQRHEGLPILDWRATLAWALRAPDDAATAHAIEQCKRGWLLHLRDALGKGYELYESDHALVLSSGSGSSARGMIEYVERTRRRIAAAIEGLATFYDGAREVLLIFDDEETYYRYVSHAYPEEGEFAFSGGMFLHVGCPHFVTVQAESQTIERVIAHEMTHASVSHLRIPLWLNEGLAVNVENRLAGALPKLFTPQEMREKHLAFWNENTIQEFWSGRSFGRPDEGHMLSYDLAQILVEILAGHWHQFRAFASEASYEDAGEVAAREHLGLDLGESIASIFEQSTADGWRPNPEKWHGEIEHAPE